MVRLLCLCVSARVVLLVSKRGKKRERKVSKSFSFFSLVCFNEESNVVACWKKKPRALPKKKKLRAKRESEKKHNREKENRRKTLRNDSSSSTNKKVKKRTALLPKHLVQQRTDCSFWGFFWFLKKRPQTELWCRKLFYVFLLQRKRTRERVRS